MENDSTYGSSVRDGNFVFPFLSNNAEESLINQTLQSLVGFGQHHHDPSSVPSSSFIHIAQPVKGIGEGTIQEPLVVRRKSNRWRSAIQCHADERPLQIPSIRSVRNHPGSQVLPSGKLT